MEIEERERRREEERRGLDDPFSRKVGKYMQVCFLDCSFFCRLFGKSWQHKNKRLKKSCGTSD